MLVGIAGDITAPFMVDETGRGGSLTAVSYLVIGGATGLLMAAAGRAVL